MFEYLTEGSKKTGLKIEIIARTRHKLKIKNEIILIKQASIIEEKIISVKGSCKFPKEKKLWRIILGN